MTRIDRYILLLYVRVLLICFASVVGLLIVVHIFTNLDEFIRYAKSNNLGLLSVFADYYGPFAVANFERLSGLLALLSLLFAIAWLNRTQEFTALMAAGVTKRRVVRPLLIASAVVILAAAGVRELVIPLYQDRLDRNPQDLAGDFPRPLRPIFDPRTSLLFQGQHLLPMNQEIVGPHLQIQGDQLSDLGTRLVADRATYSRAKDGRPAGFLLEAVHYPKNINQQASVYDLSGSPLLLTSADTDWVKPNQCFVSTDIDFEQLRGGTSWQQFASTSELIAHLQSDKQRSGNSIRVQIHQRLTRPVIDWTLLLLGIPILLSRPDRHMFWVAGACLGVVTCFTAIVLGLATLGASGTVLSPSVAVWLPLMIFFPWAWAKTASAMET